MIIPATGKKVRKLIAPLGLFLVSISAPALAYTAPPGTLAPSGSLAAPAAPPRANTLTPPSGPLTSPPRSYQAPAGTLAPSRPLASPQSAPTGNVLPTYPSPVSPPKGVLFAAPTPNGFIAGGATANGRGGLLQHQDHGGGYQTNSSTYFTPNGNSLGGSITTGPNGVPIGGTITGAKTY